MVPSVGRTAESGNGSEWRWIEGSARDSFRGRKPVIDLTGVTVNLPTRDAGRGRPARSQDAVRGVDRMVHTWKRNVMSVVANAVGTLSPNAEVAANSQEPDA